MQCCRQPRHLPAIVEQRPSMLMQQLYHTAGHPWQVDMLHCRAWRPHRQLGQGFRQSSGEKHLNL